MTNPSTHTERQAVRDRLVGDAVEKARHEGLRLGRSSKCVGLCNPDGPLTMPRPWHASEEGGCKNTGAECICECHDQLDPTKPPCPEGFHWIGQSGAWCDKCGLPSWEHDGMAKPVSPSQHPFDDAPWELDPWKPDEREAMRKKWEPDLLARATKPAAV